MAAAAQRRKQPYGNPSFTLVLQIRAMILGVSPILLLTPFPAAVIVAALKDATSFTIPNWISAGLALAFVPVALALHLPGPALGLCLMAAAVALVCGMGMFAAGWCGGGDAKLLAASALWLGWPGVLTLLAVTGLAGGALALGLITARERLAAHAGRGPAWLGRLLEPQGDLPYGLAIAVGALVAFPSSALVAGLAAP